VPRKGPRAGARRSERKGIACAPAKVAAVDTCKNVRRESCFLMPFSVRLRHGANAGTV